MNYFLGLGINDYPGSSNDLNGCIKDIEKVSFKLKSMNILSTINTLFNDGVTKHNVESYIRSIYEEHKNNYKIKNKENYLILYYSGHGTQIIGKEKDGYSEAFYWYDGPYADYELRKLFTECPEGLKIIFFMDSCFSGGMFGIKSFFNKLFGIKRIKFLEYETIPEEMLKKTSVIKNRLNNVLVFSGCRENEYSYENNEGGIFTNAVIKSLNLTKSNKEICNNINNVIDKSSYPQNPELFSDNEEFKFKLFLENNEIENPIENEETEEISDSESNFNWWILLYLFPIIGILFYLIFR
jgi:hypothetical protein